MFFVGLNICLVLIVFFWNIVIFKVFEKESFFYLLLKLLFCCLVSIDFCVGFIFEFIYIIYLMFLCYINICYYIVRLISIVSGIFCGVLLVILIVISVDRFFVLMLGLRYR